MGVKLQWDDPKIGDPENWNGLNLLGKTLNKVRLYLLHENDYKDDEDF